ncbi:cytochrome P450 [Trametes coccinea BRFM310]|uniref:Cytochrome P450 n=1 Tax=Trametes coccinea (strain BRFM310) TaxID=1353009 RepID=A0A1Y2IKV6_TRAC3|nr:cytochrome P450 [Trametes coccinea BRFM310]
MELHAYFVLGTILVVVYVWRRRRDPLNAIPTVGGPSLPLLSYIGAYRFMVRGQSLLDEGYAKYRGSAFKVAMFDQWLVVLSGTHLVEEVRKSPEEVFSSMEGVLYLTQFKHYIHPNIIKDPFHVDPIRDQLTRQLAPMLPNILDEIIETCKEHIPAKEHEWAALPGASIMLTMIARATGRAFVGVPMCRDPKYIHAAVSFTMDLVRARMFINLVPERFKPLVARFFQGPARNLHAAADTLEPLIRERESFLEREDDSEPGEKPADLLHWILESNREHGEKVHTVVTRLQLINFAAIHTSSASLTHALYHLLANPEYIPILRKEVEGAIRETGWTKASLEKMRMIDSLFKEALRYSGISLLSVYRRAMCDVKLPGGIHIPAGTLTSVAMHPIHHDEAFYKNADQFILERFSKVQGSEKDNARQQFVNTTAECVSFGRGKHACPGRFFASMELKVILAYLLMHYDMKLENQDEGRPADLRLGHSILPSRNAVVLFRKRVQVA